MTTYTKQRLTLFIDPVIAKHAKAQAVIEEVTLTALVEKALIAYIPHQTKKFISNLSTLKSASAMRVKAEAFHSNESAAIADGLATDKEKGPVIS